MACDIFQGWNLTEVCRNSESGILELYIGAYDRNLAFGLTGSYSNIISAWTAGTPSVYIIEQDPEVAGLEAPGEFTATTGFYRPALSFTLAKVSADTNGLTTLLGQGVFRVFYKDNNGLSWLVNPYKPARVSAANLTSGVAAGDPSGSTITISTFGKELPLLVSQALMDAIIVPFA